VDFSLLLKEGKNEKDLYIDNNLGGTDCLYVISGPDTWFCSYRHASGKYAESCLGLL
jgi:hypothetical protein